AEQARQQLKLEEAMLRRVAEIEKRAKRAAQRRAERERQRDMILRQKLKRDLQVALHIQERRLDKVLGADCRRRGAALAVACARQDRVVGCTQDEVPGAGAQKERRTDAVLKRRVAIQEEELRLRVACLERRSAKRSRAFPQINQLVPG
ncbi:unnamed protein product, partial [Choristocarpus tenellus]